MREQIVHFINMTMNYKKRKKGIKVQKSEIIKEAFDELQKGRTSKAEDILKNVYPFVPIAVEKRSYKLQDKMRIFMRDHFIDRYSGDKLVNPGVLKLFSVRMQEAFPYHPHWKMDETHIAYWELTPTIDHINPLALGGADSEENWITTSMLHNQIKSNWTLEQIGWSIKENLADESWDGLTKDFVRYVDEYPELLKDTYIAKWYKESKKYEST